MQEDELLPLLNQARTTNQAHAVTGMLLYVEGRFFTQKEGRFIQVIEGSKKDVEAIYKKIRQDKRHKELIVLQQSAISKRNFDTWTMGFKAMKLETYMEIPDYFELNDDFLHSNMHSSSIAINFLKSFYKTNRENDLDVFQERKLA